MSWRVLALICGLVSSPAVAQGLLDLWVDDPQEQQATTPAPIMVEQPEEEEAPVDISGFPVAIVSLLEPGGATMVQENQLLYLGDKVDLRSDGYALISYFSTCREEAITRGVVRISLGSSEMLENGEIENRLIKCRRLFGRPPIGVRPGRGKESLGGPWHEFTIRSTSPLFVWPLSANGSVILEVRDMDQLEPQILWQAETDAHWLSYPDDAPKLQPGRPYEVKLRWPDGRDEALLFSIDPDLDVAVGKLSRVLPLTGSGPSL